MSFKGVFSLLLLAALSACSVQEVSSAELRNEEVRGRSLRQSPGSNNFRPRVTSPCPEVLSNIKMTRNRGRWYGLISVTSDRETNGVVFDILLDSPAELIGTAFGEVFTNDNYVFTIRNDNRRVNAGQIIPFRFFVKFNRTASSPPNVKAIAFNGRQICPSDEGFIQDAYPSSPAGSENTFSNPTSTATSTPTETVNPFGLLGGFIPETYPSSPSESENTFSNPTSSATSTPPETVNRFGLLNEESTLPAVLPLDNSAGKSYRREQSQGISGTRDSNPNEYQIEWKGNPKKIIGKLSDTPDLYMINGEFKIKSNASLLILLIARPPHLQTQDHEIPGGELSIFGGETMDRNGKGITMESQLENVNQLLTKVFGGGSRKEYGLTESASTGFPVSSTEHNDENGELPSFTLDVETSSVPLVEPEQPTTSGRPETTTTPESPPEVGATTPEIPGETECPTEMEGGRETDTTHLWTSPCPGVFSYLADSIVDGAWNGSLSLPTKDDILGIRLDVQLDKPSSLSIVGALFGEVMNTGNISFTVWDYTTLIPSGEAINAEIFARYDQQEDEPPRIKAIRLNGRLICPARKVTTTTVLPGEDLLQGNGPNPFTDSANIDAPTTFSPDVPTDEPVTSLSQEKMLSGEEASALPDEQNSLNSGSASGTVQGTPGDDGMACGKMGVEQIPLTSYEQRTTRGQWPWHAAIYQLRGDDRFYICGGTLIGKQSVLTAARCLSDGRPVDRESLVVHLGMHTLHQWGEEVQSREVQEIHINPDYNSTNLNGNLAVLILSSPVELSTYVRPVCLWNGKDEEPNDIRGEEGVVAGWGYDKLGLLEESLIIAKMPVLYQRACLWNYPELFQFLSENIYCAGYKSETTICNGESGDGMYFPIQENQTSGSGDNSPSWTIRGVASFALSPSNGIECSAKNYVVFTDVTKYHGWIEQYR